MKENNLRTLKKIIKDYDAEYSNLLKTQNEALMTYERKFHDLYQNALKSLKDEIRRLASLGHVFVEPESPLLSVLKRGPEFFQYSREFYSNNTVDNFIDHCSIDVKLASLKKTTISDIEDMVVLTPKDIETIKKHWNAAKDNECLDDTMTINVKAFLKSNNMEVSDLKKVLDNMANKKG